MQTPSTASSRSPIAIFDFDGTLADSLELVINEYNKVAPRFRAKQVDRRELPRLRKLKAGPAMKEHNISFWKLPLLVSVMRSAMHAHVDGLRPYDGIGPALHALSAAGCRCSILSTNSGQNITRFLARHDLKLFEHIAGGSSMFGKARALKRLIARAQFDARDVFYIGDEARDVEAASKAGVRSIAVSWGYADRAVLAAHGPTHVADRPEDLVSLLAPR